jgi:DNA-binding NarL/FixJ family response regulator
LSLPTREPSLADQLSEREKQVLRLVAAGLANKQIACRLGIAESTVKVHTGNIFRRVGVTERTSAALWAKEHL